MILRQCLLVHKDAPRDLIAKHLDSWLLRDYERLNPRPEILERRCSERLWEGPVDPAPMFLVTHTWRLGEC
jgi:hypothetical protein